MTHVNSCQRRALVLAPFFSLDAPSRPRAVAEALAELMPVDVVTADFDHGRKVRREPMQSRKVARIIYVKTPAYGSNVSVARLVSHVVFSLRALRYIACNRHIYDTIYATAPLNSLAWLAFVRAGSATKILDVVDIWPESLPLSPSTKRVLTPILRAWKWLFTSSVQRADVILSGSDVFLAEAKRHAKTDAQVAHFYISHDRLWASVPKEPLFTLAYVGNIGHLYDFEALVGALSDQILRGATQLFIIGAGDRKDWLLDNLGGLGIRYRYFGAVFDAGRLGAILCSCHAGFNGYVRTSASFSYKAATYLAAGLPIVNSMRGDLRDLIERYGLGENYEAGNPQQLREALLRLVRRESGEVEANCREFFQTRIETGRVHEQIKSYLARQLGCDVSRIDSL
jgi:glycosyltransferase involved in cell wall biosynthesis